MASARLCLAGRTVLYYLARRFTVQSSAVPIRRGQLNSWSR